MKNQSDTIIYVGKAQNLRNRVRSYFTGSHDAKTQRLVMDIVDFDYIVTHSPLEALILECNLIKQHRPRYNVLLKDDKSYPYIRLTKERHPRLEVTREIKKDGSRYFGPYPHAGAAQQTKKLLDRLFPLRKCRQLPKRVCLYYHLGQCLAPCEKEVDPEQYEQMIKKIVRFLNGGAPEWKSKLKRDMEEAAERLEFEKAKELRDLIQDIEATMEKQHIDFQDRVDRDVFGFHAEKGWLCVQVFFIRQGRLIERKVSISPHYHEAEEDLLTYIAQFYQDNPVRPKEILLPKSIDEDLVAQLLPEVKIHVPQRGAKRHLIAMAMENAKLGLQGRFKWMERDQARTAQAMEELAEALGMDLPRRIEAFDNSNIQGTDPVSAMVVFQDGKPDKKEYRKFKIRTVSQPDDYETMREVIRRRYTRVLKQNLPLPDLILVDGGKGQGMAAIDVLENELGMSIPVGALSKDDKHKTSKLLLGESMIEVNIPKGTQGFYLLQRIQEEVHRFAISFHRQTRKKKQFQSILDEVPGVGEKRKKRLYQHFGSLEKMREADLEEFQKAGISLTLGQAIQERLQKQKEKD